MEREIIMAKKKYVDFILKQTKDVLSIDSPTGYTRNAAEYVAKQYESLGYKPVITTKGSVLVEIGGEDANDAILLAAHCDTLGGMVKEIKGNGYLKLSPLGGMNPNNAETENVKIITKSDKIYEGTLQLENASIHVNKEYNDTKRTWDNMEVVIDEKTSSKDDTLKLGIEVGDIVCFDPRTTITNSGYIKSRFLDDKLSVAILLGYAKYLKDENIKLKHKMYHYITVYEEVGHGGAASIPDGVKEMISVDMGCVGNGLGCTERQVSICAKDSHGPYNYDVVKGLMETAKKHKIDYCVDIYPFYGSDVDTTLCAGYELRHGLIGSGVYASHGYERSHVDGVKNTLDLLIHYCK